MALPNEVPVPIDHQERLLHDVERHLKPKSKPQRRTRAQSVRRIRRIALTVAFLWLVGVGGALSGTVMASEGFRVDVLQQQLQQASREQQHLAGLVAAATSPSALAQDASQLHVQLGPTVVPRPAPTRQPSLPTLASRVTSTLSGFWKTLKTLEAGGHR